MSSDALAGSIPETIDREMYRLVHGFPHTRTGDRYLTMLSDLGNGPGWVAASAALAAIGGRRGRRAAIATTVASLGTAYLVQNVIKPVFRRKRPFVGRDLLVVGIRTTDASFPSGHSASSFAAAVALGASYPKAWPLVFALATGVALSRIRLGHHFPSDVAIGALVGIGTGTVVSRTIAPASRTAEENRQAP